jgi:hypothetical protein
MQNHREPQYKEETLEDDLEDTHALFFHLRFSGRAAIAGAVIGNVALCTPFIKQRSTRMTTAFIAGLLWAYSTFAIERSWRNLFAHKDMVAWARRKGIDTKDPYGPFERHPAWGTKEH